LSNDEIPRPTPPVPENTVEVVESDVVVVQERIK
jgi:hypothetical protein